MISLRGIAKKCAFALLSNSYLLRRRLERLRTTQAVTILNLHSVSEAGGREQRPLRPDLFEDLLRYIIRHFDVVTFAEIGEPRSKPKLVLSFDDGYRDFLTVVAPMLAKYGLRANQNVIPACVESGRPPLNVVAGDFVERAPVGLVRAIEVPGFDMSDPRRLGHRLSAFIKNRPISEQRTLQEALEPQFRRWAEFEPTPVMNRTEVLEIAQTHEIGAHSYEHASMAFETDDYVREDLVRCRDYFEHMLGQPMTIYAFPNGSCREDHISIALQEGIEHVLLVGEGFSTDATVHRRFTFDAAGRPEARVRAVGGLKPIPA